MKIKAVCFSVLFSNLILISSASFASRVPPLTPEQINTLTQGKQVLIKAPLEGSKWAQFTIYEIIPGVTPREAAAATMAWDQKRTYTNGLTKSEIVSSNFGGAEALVDYTVKVFLVGPENFTMDNKIVSYEGQSYEVDSTMTKADRTKSSVNVTHLENWDNKGTLMEIHVETTPPSIPGIGLAEGHAISQAQDAFHSFALHVVEEKTQSPQTLSEQLSHFDQAMTLLQATQQK